MKVDIYLTSFKSPERGEAKYYLMIEEGKEPSSIVPTDILCKIGKLKKTKNIDLKPMESRIALDSKEAYEEIIKNGFYLYSIAIKCSLSTSPI